MSPPISVTVITGSFSCSRNPAESVLKGCFCCWMTLGLLGSSVNRAPRLCSMKQKPGTVIPDPNATKLLVTHETMLPSPSAVESTIVSPPIEKFPEGPGVDACAGSPLAQSVPAYEADSSRSSGTGEKCGSALYWYRSA